MHLAFRLRFYTVEMGPHLVCQFAWAKTRLGNSNNNFPLCPVAISFQLQAILSTTVRQLYMAAM
jgi:hypothetical protein